MITCMGIELTQKQWTFTIICYFAIAVLYIEAIKDNIIDVPLLFLFGLPFLSIAYSFKSMVWGIILSGLIAMSATLVFSTYFVVPVEHPELTSYITLVTSLACIFIYYILNCIVIAFNKTIADAGRKEFDNNKVINKMKALRVYHETTSIIARLYLIVYMMGCIISSVKLPCTQAVVLYAIAICVLKLFIQLYMQSLMRKMESEALLRIRDGQGKIIK